MKIFLNGCTTACEKCSYFQNRLCMHPDNPSLRSAHVPLIELGKLSKYCGGSVTKKNVFTVVSHNGVNKVILSRSLDK